MFSLFAKVNGVLSDERNRKKRKRKKRKRIDRISRLNLRGAKTTFDKANWMFVPWLSQFDFKRNGETSSDGWVRFLSSQND